MTAAVFIALLALWVCALFALVLALFLRRLRRDDVPEWWVNAWSDDDAARKQQQANIHRLGPYE